MSSPSSDARRVEATVQLVERIATATSPISNDDVADVVEASGADAEVLATVATMTGRPLDDKAISEMFLSRQNELIQRAAGYCRGTAPFTTTPQVSEDREGKTNRLLRFNLVCMSGSILMIVRALSEPIDVLSAIGLFLATCILLSSILWSVRLVRRRRAHAEDW